MQARKNPSSDSASIAPAIQYIATCILPVNVK